MPFFKKNKSGKVSLECPYCKAVQEESSLALSTNCRKCNQYYKIQDGQAVSSSPAQSIRTYKTEVIAAVGKDETSLTEEPSSVISEESELAQPPAPILDSEEKLVFSESAEEANTIDLLPNEKAESAETEATEALITEDVMEVIPPVEPEIEKALPVQDEVVADDGLDSKASPLGTPPPIVNEEPSSLVPVPEALFSAEAEAPQRFIASEGANKYSKYKGDPLEKLIICYDCGNPHSIIKTATSSLCPHCGTYISVKDHSINSAWNTSIRTRGDVYIGKKGVLKNISVACNNLTIDGIFESSVDCQNNLIVRSNSHITGKVVCRRLIIEKKTEVTLSQSLHVEEVIIDGKLSIPRLRCDTQVVLRKHAILNGDLQTKSLNLEEGAIHQGLMQLG